MKKQFVTLTLMSLALVVTSPQNDTQSHFFDNLKQMCGQQLEGQTVLPQNADHPLVGKRLLMTVQQCTDTEIRIPFQVGDDKSRTWIITLTDKGLLLKHDHRHPDGTPDKITMYGGLAAPNGTAHLQRFPADAETTKLIPEAATNVWTLEMIPEKNQFIYYLERNQEPRYKALFSFNPRQ